MNASETPERFWNWLKPSAPGLFGLSLGAVVVSGAGLILGMLFVIKGNAIGMLSALGATFIVVLLGFVRFGGLTPLERLSDSISLARRRRSGEAFYVTGAMGTLPAEFAERLPGALLDVDAISGRDGLDREFALLHHRSVGQLAAVFGCSPDGAAMQDQSTVDAQVANFGGWLSEHSVEDGLAGATIVVDSASESSAAMIQTMRDTVAPDAPAFAKDVLSAAAGTLPARTATVNVYATLVYDVAELGGTRDLSTAVAEVAARMPYQSASLQAAGAGNAKPQTEAELSQAAQLAYQPTRDAELALDELAGHKVARPWSQAGPGFFDDSQGRVVFHDGVASMTLMMTIPPGAHITARSFERVFAPNAKFLRKRVALIYRPVDPGQGARTVDGMVKNAQWRMDTRRGRATSFDRAAKDVAEKTEEQLARGARLSAFALMVTVTFAPTEKAYRDALTQVKSLMNSVILSYRFVEHAGSAAFHTTLPFGVLPWAHTLKPLWMEGVL
jgi:hypothetical protein